MKQLESLLDLYMGHGLLNVFKLKKAIELIEFCFELEALRVGIEN